MKVSTFFALLAEFGTGDIPLDQVCEKYFGLSKEEASARARRHKLPVPAFRTGSQKAGWLISAHELATFIDGQRSQARQDWEKTRAAGTV